MSENFRLGSLHLGTIFDTPIVPLRVPGVLGKGAATALCMVDGANRAPHRLSRLVRPAALLGAKLEQIGLGVRISMPLIADDLSTELWDRQRRRTENEPAPDNENYVLPDVSRMHRLLEVTVQGRARALAVLALRPNDNGAVRQRLEFELAADEIGESGLIMLGFQQPSQIPEWADVNRLADGAIGVCVVHLQFDLLGTESVTAHVSTGRPPLQDGPVAVANPGYFVLNPGADDGPTAVRLTARGAGGDRLLGRRAKVKHPLRLAREWNDDRRAVAGGPAVVEVVDLAGRTLVSTEVPEDGDGGHVLTVPAGAGPVYVRARKRPGTSDTPRPVNWSVATSPARP